MKRRLPRQKVPPSVASVGADAGAAACGGVGHENDEAIAAAADAIERGGGWPSSAAVVERTGLSPATVKRHAELLTPARRRWVKRNGTHSHWRDVSDTGEALKPRRLASAEQRKLEEQLEHAVRIARERGEALARARAEIERLSEVNARLLAGVRPPDVLVARRSGSR
jgi:hypothetical protein